MQTHLITEIERDPTCLLLMKAYSAREPLSADGWVERLRSVPGLEGIDLSALHGKLIAFGLMDFELGSGSGGMRYQVSSLGKKTMQAQESSCEEDDYEDLQDLDAA